MRLDLTRAGIWPRRGGRDRKTWRDLKRDYVVQLLLQRTIVELDQASGRSEGTEGETRKARHGRRDTEGEARMQFTVVLDERRGRRGAEGETRMQFTVVLDERRGRRGTEGEARKVRHEMLNKEIESLAGLGFQDLKDSSIKTWRKDTSVET